MNRSAKQLNGSMKPSTAIAVLGFFVVVLSIECDENLWTLPNLVFDGKYHLTIIYFKEKLWLNKTIYVDVCPTI